MLVDLASPKFWLLVTAATLVLTPLTHARCRRIAFAVVNLVFLWMMLHVELLGLLAALIVLYGILQVMGRSRAWRWAAAVVLIVSSALFVAHKLPAVARQIGVAHLSPLLVAIGYSYVFLRLIDMSRAVWEKRHPPPDPLSLLNYLLPFHMLAAGPIQAFDDFIAQPAVPPALNFEQSLTLIERIVQGLFKKYVLAFAVDAIFLFHGRAGGWYRLVEMNMTYVWLYLDFSAYSDIAVGVGGLMGVATPENFNRPYLARNITDFWERWHISLSLWIRRNLFFPIQLSLARRTQGKYSLTCASVAIFISFLLCGAWHGLTPPFFWWGVANGAGLVICNIYRQRLKKKLGAKGVNKYLANQPIRWLAMALTFEFVAFTIMLIASKWGGTS